MEALITGSKMKIKKLSNFEDLSGKVGFVESWYIELNGGRKWNNIRTLRLKTGGGTNPVDGNLAR